MDFRHLSEFLRYLERRGELRRVSVSVDGRSELAEIVARVAHRDGPAVLFERVDGSPFPLVTNLLGSPRRVAWALGAERLDEIGERFGKLLGLVQGGAPERLGDKLRLFGQVRELASLGPRPARHPACQEVVNTAAPTFADLPRIGGSAGDDATPCRVALYLDDPATGERAALPADVRVVGPTTAAVVVRADGPAGRGLRRPDQPAALDFGGDPATHWASLAGPPGGLDPLVLAGYLRSAAVPTARGRTIELDVPAEAELVFEGRLSTPRPDGRAPDGDGAETPAASFTLTAVTRRREPVLPLIVAGRPPSEDTYLDLASERLWLPFVRLAVPEVVDYHVPAGAAGRGLVVAAVRAAFPGAARKAMYGLWGLNLFADARGIVAVDAEVDPRDAADVLWRTTHYVEPIRDVFTLEGPVRGSHAGERRLGGKLGIDATRKDGAGGDVLNGPDPATVRLVDRRWSDYGLP